MKRVVFVILVSLLLQMGALARNKQKAPPPLMPPRVNEDENAIPTRTLLTANQPTAVPATPSTHVYTTVASTAPKAPETQTTSSYHRESTSPFQTGALLGVEGGFLGRQQSTDSDYLGHQIFWGGRVFFEIPVNEMFLIRPTAGYFIKNESTAAITVSQKHIEAGIGAFYRLGSDRVLSMNLGLSQRLTYALTSLSAYSVSNTPAGEILYRLGPAAQFDVRLSRVMSLVLGLEYTWTLSSPTRGFAGSSAGFGFSL